MDGVWLGTGGEVTEGFLISVVVRLLVARGKRRHRGI